MINTVINSVIDTVFGVVSRRAVIASLIAAVLIVPVGGQAIADPDYPSQSDIDKAQETEDGVEDAVAEAEQRLWGLDQRLDELHVAAGQAVEAYNGARVALAKAEEAEEAASEEAERASVEAELAHDDLGRYAAASYRSGGSLGVASTLLTAAESDEFVDRTVLLDTATRSQAEATERYVTAAASAEEAAAEAEAALAEREEAERAAEVAGAAATAAVEEQKAMLADAETEREALMVELADARGTTAQLERERQAALEEEARLERERQERERAEQEEREREERERQEQENDEQENDEQENDEQENDEQEGDEQEGDEQEEPDPEPPSSDVSAAEAAVAYARAQLGKPYEWAADGPDTFDCSGLTMRAWEQGGVSLSHWSVAQANETARVSYDQLVPGDLIFWSNNDAPSGTYHVALYIGDGQMIHAPSTGKDVEIQDVFYWETPSFYGRV